MSMISMNKSEQARELMDGGKAECVAVKTNDLTTRIHEQASHVLSQNSQLHRKHDDVAENLIALATRLFGADFAARAVKQADGDGDKAIVDLPGFLKTDSFASAAFGAVDCFEQSILGQHSRVNWTYRFVRAIIEAHENGF